jgi:superkiller protein 3
MSLIIDALKRAQQLRLKEPQATPILTYPSLNMKKGRASKKQWMLFGASLIIFCIILFFLLRPASPPLATQSYRAIVPREIKPSPLIAEKISLEPSVEVSNRRKDENPLPTGKDPDLIGSGQAATPAPSNAAMALSDRPSSPILEKGSSLVKSSLNQKRRGSTVKEAPQEETKPLKRILTEEISPPLPFPTHQEEVSSKSIEVEQEGGKGPTVTLEVIDHFNSGVLFLNQREFSKAIQAYQKVIELDPSFVEAYNNLGIAYQMIGEIDKAFEAYERTTKINPNYEKGYNNLGTLFFLEGRYAEALETFQKALAINSNNIESHINLGILFKKKGQLEKAIECYHTALTIDPFHKETYYNIALLYEEMEKWELAISHYRQFIQIAQKSYPELVSKVQRHLNELTQIKNK